MDGVRILSLPGLSEFLNPAVDRVNTARECCKAALFTLA